MNLHPSSQNKPGTSEFCRKKTYCMHLRTNHKMNKLMLSVCYCKTCNTRALLSDASVSKKVK